MEDDRARKLTHVAPDKTKVQYVVPRAWKRGLETQAAHEQRTMTDIVTDAVDQYIQANKPAPKRGRPRRAS